MTNRKKELSNKIMKKEKTKPSKNKLNDNVVKNQLPNNNNKTKNKTSNNNIANKQVENKNNNNTTKKKSSNNNTANKQVVNKNNTTKNSQTKVNPTVKQNKVKYQNKIINNNVEKSQKKAIEINKNFELIEKKQIKKSENKFNIILNKIKLFIIKFSKKFKLNKYLVIILSVIVVLTVVLFFLKENPTGMLHIYKKYIIGDKITLGDKYVWYVIEDSDTSNEKVKLISEKPIDINNDGKVNDKDKVQFDKDGDFEFDQKDKNSIIHILNGLKTTSLKYISGLNKVTLLTSKEYINIRKRMEYDYTWNEGNWLASKSIGTWWINTSNNGKVYAVNKNGSYRLDSATKKHYIRPVIILYKSEM